MRLTAPPVLPWLLFVSSRADGDTAVKHMYSTVDGEVFRVPIPSQLVGKGFLGSHDGGWVAAAAGRQGPLVIVNLFTGAEVALSVHGAPSVVHKIFSGPPTSRGQLHPCCHHRQVWSGTLQDWLARRRVDHTRLRWRASRRHLLLQW
jgi:hypothetical protein